ncbi:MAG: hypothetical protein AB7F20_12735, partial [Geoalkalibacter sp.]
MNRKSLPFGGLFLLIPNSSSRPTHHAPPITPHPSRPTHHAPPITPHPSRPTHHAPPITPHP